MQAPGGALVLLTHPRRCRNSGEVRVNIRIAAYRVGGIPAKIRFRQARQFGSRPARTSGAASSGPVMPYGASGSQISSAILSCVCLSKYARKPGGPA